VGHPVYTIYIYERGVPGGALNLNSAGYPDHGHYGGLPLQGKIPMVEPGIEPRTSQLVVRSSDHQATRLVTSADILNCLFPNKSICIPLHPLPTGNMHGKIIDP
jgi:hypothetical protein